MAAPLLRLATRSVRKNWRHSVGSILAIATGFVAIGLFDGYLLHFERQLVEMMERRFMMGTVIVDAAGASDRLASTPADLPQLDTAGQAFIDEYLTAHGAEVEARVRFLFIWGYASTGQASTLFTGWGYDPVEGAFLRGPFAWDALAGWPLHRAGPVTAQLGKGLGGLLDCLPTSDLPTAGKDGRPIPEVRPFTCRRPRVQLVGTTASGQVNAVEPEVVGIVDGGQREMDLRHVALPLALAQRLRNTSDVSYYSVRLWDPARAAAFSRDLAAAARSRGLAIEARPMKKHAMGAPLVQGMQLLGAFRGLMAMVVIAIAGMAIFTTMVKSVSERTREIGTLRSLGFLRRHVVGLFGIEAVLLSAVASGAGLMATLALTAAVNGSGVTYQAGLLAEPIPLGIAIDPTGLAQTALLLGLVALVAALLPARRASRLRIQDALGHA